MGVCVYFFNMLDIKIQEKTCQSPSIPAHSSIVGLSEQLCIETAFTASLLSLHISHCQSREDIVDTKDKGSHQRRRAPEARAVCELHRAPQTSAKLVSAFNNCYEKS